MGNINIFMDPRMARFLHQIAGCTPGGGGGGGGTIDTVARADATQALSDAADAQATADAALAAANQAASDVADALDTADTALGLATSAYDTANNAFLGKIKFSGQAVADLIEANTDDWDITGFAAASGVRVQSDAAYDITGLMGGEDGRIVFLYNVGTFDLTLKHMSGSSSSGNQFACGGSDKVLPGLGACLLYYGGGVWFVIGL